MDSILYELDYNNYQKQANMPLNAKSKETDRTTVKAPWTINEITQNIRPDPVQERVDGW